MARDRGPLAIGAGERVADRTREVREPLQATHEIRDRSLEVLIPGRGGEVTERGQRGIPARFGAEIERIEPERLELLVEDIARRGAEDDGVEVDLGERLR